MPAAKKTIAAAWKLANFVAGCPAPAPTGERESVVTASAAGDGSVRGKAQQPKHTMWRGVRGTPPSGTKSSMTKLHARALPVRESNPCFLPLKALRNYPLCARPTGGRDFSRSRVAMSQSPARVPSAVDGKKRLALPP